MQQRGANQQQTADADKQQKDNSTEQRASEEQEWQNPVDQDILDILEESWTTGGIAIMVAICGIDVQGTVPWACNVLPRGEYELEVWTGVVDIRSLGILY